MPSRDRPPRGRLACPPLKDLLKADPRFPILRYVRVDRYVSRPIQWLIVRAILNTPITPNQVSYASFFLGAAAAAMLFRGGHLFYVAGGILALLSSIVDGVDGLLARAKNQCSDFGAHLDLFLDRVVDFLIFGGIVYAAWHESGAGWILVAGLVALNLYHLQVALFYLVENYRRSGLAGKTGEVRGLAYYLIALAAILNRFDLYVLVLGVESVGNLLYRFILLYWLRKNHLARPVDPGSPCVQGGSGATVRPAR